MARPDPVPAPAQPTPPGKWRRRLQRTAAALAIFALVSWWVGCTSLVRPPTSPADPESVYILRNALHRGLVLPAEDPGRYVEFSFGDREWYANKNTSWYRAVPTVLWPTSGVFGAREIPASSEAELRGVLSFAELLPVVVERDDVVALRRRLRSAWDSGRESGGPSVRSYGLDFVAADDGYWIFYNCADAVALWLEELGCAVSWLPVRLDLEVAR